jgi:hypothetical protein
MKKSKLSKPFKEILYSLIFTSISLSAKSIGIVIGADSGGLISAINDAKDIAKVLEDRGVFVNYKLYGENATKTNILESLESIKNSINRGDWVYFFFSGHGTSPYDPNLRDKKLKREIKNSSALISSDQKYIVVKEDLAPTFKLLDKRGVNIILIVDACFSGVSYKDIFSNKSRKFVFYSKKLTEKEEFPYKKLRFFGSTTYSDYALESGKHRRGYFSRAFANCISKYAYKSDIKICLDDIKYNKKELPQVPIILPEYDFPIFPIN